MLRGKLWTALARARSPTPGALLLERLARRDVQREFDRLFSGQGLPPASRGLVALVAQSRPCVRLDTVKDQSTESPLGHAVLAVHAARGTDELDTYVGFARPAESGPDREERFGHRVRLRLDRCLQLEELSQRALRCCDPVRILTEHEQAIGKVVQ